MKPVFIVFDGPPNHDSGRFVEVETAEGKSVSDKDFPWTEDGDYWKLGPFYTADQLRQAKVEVLRELGNKLGQKGSFNEAHVAMEMADELEKGE